MELINEDSLFFRQETGDFIHRPAATMPWPFPGSSSTDWLVKRDKARAALALRWAPAKVDEQGLGDDEDPSLGTVKPVETWEPGKVGRLSAPARASDNYRFYYDLQNAFYDGEAKLGAAAGLPRAADLAATTGWTAPPTSMRMPALTMSTATPTGPTPRAAMAMTPRSPGIPAPWSRTPACRHVLRRASAELPRPRASPTSSASGAAARPMISARMACW